MKSNISLAILFFLVLVTSSLSALAEGSACVPELLTAFSEDTAKLEGETAAPVVGTFDLPQEPVTGVTLPICPATYTKFGYCVNPTQLAAWKTHMR